VDTDFALSDVDFRSHEKLFQLMTQVSGRAGRGQKEGMVWLQTWQPDHPLFRDIAQHDWTAFVQRELHQRQMMDNPPYVRLTTITVSHRTEWEASKSAQEWGRLCPPNSRVKVFGPAPAPMNPLRDWWRWRFLVKSPLGLDLHTWLTTWIDRVPADMRKGVQLSIDRDPFCFL
jgi:primosomal protein N' (replication factor Y)